ncbi:MAG: hypothetical protein KAT17_07210 [Candidatus Aminicenantes bacterium]|nr:hypothetical protein [Candidatus Aminicenantes bacterium]
MKKVNLILFFFLFIGLWLIGDNSKDLEQKNDSFQFIKSYRYTSNQKKEQREFPEVAVVLKKMAKVYFDFTSLGSQHFSQDPVGYLERLLSKTSIGYAFLIISDRLVRNIAFVSGLYEIDIKTGLAIDPFDVFIKK